MTSIPREQLLAYLDDALGEADTAKIEDTLRQSESLRKELRAVMQQLDRGEHSVGAIWRRQRLTCPNRERLGSFLLGVLGPEANDYLTFHVTTIGCPFCQANLADLEAQQKEANQRVQARRKRYFDSSAGLLRRK